MRTFPCKDSSDKNRLHLSFFDSVYKQNYSYQDKFLNIATLLRRIKPLFTHESNEIYRAYIVPNWRSLNTHSTAKVDHR